MGLARPLSSPIRYRYRDIDIRMGTADTFPRVTTVLVRVTSSRTRHGINISGLVLPSTDLAFPVPGCLAVNLLATLWVHQLASIIHYYDAQQHNSGGPLMYAGGI